MLRTDCLEALGENLTVDELCEMLEWLLKTLRRQDGERLLKVLLDGNRE